MWRLAFVGFFGLIAPAGVGIVPTNVAATEKLRAAQLEFTESIRLPPEWPAPKRTAKRRR